MINKVVFIVSKPLQYMISDIISHNLDSEKYLIVIDSFSQARQVAERISKNKKWHMVSTVKNRFLSLVKAAFYKPKILYIDTDVGLRLYFYILIFKTLNFKSKVYVYEEGLGTYRTDIYNGGQFYKFKSNLFKKVGVSTFFGGSTFCDGVYVFKPDEYKIILKPLPTKNIYAISPSLIQYCSLHTQRLLEEFAGKTHIGLPVGKKCIIYLSSWAADIEAFEVIYKKIKPQVKILKLHPHIKKIEKEIIGFDIIINNSIPAEILLIEALSCFEKVYVVHHGTSVESYVDHNRVVFMNILKYNL
jgi:hypothetical protein